MPFKVTGEPVKAARRSRSYRFAKKHRPEWRKWSGNSNRHRSPNAALRFDYLMVKDNPTPQKPRFIDYPLVSYEFSECKGHWRPSFRP